MVELKWRAATTLDDHRKAAKVPGGTSSARVLQYRILMYRIDASGSLNVIPPEWSEWIDVPVDE